MSEVALDSEAVSRFRTNYRGLFGAGISDALYESISEGCRFQGMEHWLPLFHDGMDTLFAFVPDAVVSLDYQAEESINARIDQIEEFYNARKEAEKDGLSEGGIIYHPVPAELMFLSKEEFERSDGRCLYDVFERSQKHVGSTRKRRQCACK